MARIKLNLPDNFQFETDIPVRGSDLNYGGHVGNDTMLTLLQEARIHFYRSIGYENELSFDGNVGQIIADAAIQYKAESFLGDVLRIRIAALDFNKYGFNLFYMVTHRESGKEIARAKTGIVCFDYAKRQVASIPQSLLARLI